MHGELRHARDQNPIGENFRPQAAFSAQPRLGAPRHRLLHPVARLGFAGAFKPDSPDLKPPADERIKVGAFQEHIAPKGAGGEVRHGQFAFDGLVNFPREERHLPFVIGLVVEKAVALQAAPGTTGHLPNRHDGIFPGRLAVMPEVIVTG